MYYYNMQQIHTIEPNYGSVNHDTNITLYGQNFWPWDPDSGHDFR